MRWTTGEIRYLEAHAGEGAAAVARALGRSVESVRCQAKRYGLSLRLSWRCPRCGARTRAPLSPRTGWCRACTMASKRERVAEEVRALEAEVRRERQEERERQRLYARKHRAKRALESLTRE